MKEIVVFIHLSQVQTKRKRHGSKDRKEVQTTVTSYGEGGNKSSAKALKRCNFERLISRMNEEYPKAERYW